MINWILEFWGNPYLAILCYWMPLVVCFIGYILRTNENYQKDIANRDAYESYQLAKVKVECDEMKDEDFKQLYPKSDYCYSYTPTDTYGSLLGRALLTIVPIANIFAAIFDVSPKLFQNLFDWISKVFNTPIVKKVKP